MNWLSQDMGTTRIFLHRVNVAGEKIFGLRGPGWLCVLSGGHSKPPAAVVGEVSESNRSEPQSVVKKSTLDLNAVRFMRAIPTSISG
jgi:hypothetical protein